MAFFALSGFVFLIVLYFQITHGYSPLNTDVRILPVAIAIAVSSGLGTILAMRIGNKIVVAAGLGLVAIGYGWVAAFQTAHTSCWLIVGQMILLGVGMGLSTTPATEAILGVVKPAQAGIGSAVNDATRLVGATLGVAVIGSIYSSRYTDRLDHTSGVPAACLLGAAGVLAFLPPTPPHQTPVGPPWSPPLSKLRETFGGLLYVAYIKTMARHRERQQEPPGPTKNPSSRGR